MAQKLYFLAADGQGNDVEDLWVTDGTTTTAVGGAGDSSLSGVSNSGLGPVYITASGQFMYFGGADLLDDGASNGLWQTDDSNNDTIEVGGPNMGTGHSTTITGANPEGLMPDDFVAFGDHSALFTGLDAKGFDGLWSTDGTTSGTVEIGGLENGKGTTTIANRGENWDPQNFAAFGNNVIFNAYDNTKGDEYIGMWVTDGTTAGTEEIGGKTNAAIFDSNDDSFEENNGIALGDSLLFTAQNKEGDETLWVTDGTAPGTQEIGGVNNDGVLGANNTGLGNGLANAVRLGARVFFNGLDADDTHGLWTTDGTALGTQEVGGLGGLGLKTYLQKPSTLGVNPTDITANGQDVLFNGADSIGFQELWVSDGTTAGTYEIGGASPTGPLEDEAIDGLNPYSIVSLGNGKAVFIGYDNSNNENSGKPTLWVTDGTAAGTEEIGGLNNQMVSDIDDSGFDLTDDLIGGGGLAYFIGEDKDGHSVLWETDGTLGGTKIDAATDGNADSDGLLPSDPDHWALAPPPPSADTFSGGGQTIALDNTGSVNLSDTENDFDTVNGSNGSINLSAAQAAVIGGGVLMTLVGIGNAVKLSGTNGNKDSVYGAKGAITLNGAQANVFGSKNNITFATGTTGNVVYLYDTQGAADTVSGSGGSIYLDNAQVSITGSQNQVYVELGTNDSDVITLSTGSIDPIHIIENNHKSGATVAIDGYTNGEQVAIVGLDSKYAPADPYITPDSSFSLSISGGTVTQTNLDGSTQISSYGLPGQDYTRRAIDKNAKGEFVAKYFSGVTGQGALTAYEYLYAGNSQIGTDEFYAGITGKPYTAEETDFNGANQLTRDAFSALSANSPYSSYEYDYVGGVFKGSRFTYTKVPSGATYSSYELDYNHANALASEKFYYTNVTGQTYTGEQLNFDANNKLTSELLTGISGQAYDALELDYSAGTYEGYKLFYPDDNTGFATEEVDISAANKIEKVVYTGVINTPYQTVEQDYANGALADTIYGYTDVAAPTYNAYQVKENTSNVALSETFDLNSGGHNDIAEVIGQTLTSLGNDKMTGASGGATDFVFAGIYGAGVITNLTSLDHVSLPSSEFSTFSDMFSHATPSGGNMLISAADGDTLTLKNMTTTQLSALSADFSFP